MVQQAMQYKVSYASKENSSIICRLPREKILLTSEGRLARCSENYLIDLDIFINSWHKIKTRLCSFKTVEQSFAKDQQSYVSSKTSFLFRIDSCVFLSRAHILTFFISDENTSDQNNLRENFSNWSVVRGNEVIT